MHTVYEQTLRDLVQKCVVSGYSIEFTLTYVKLELMNRGLYPNLALDATRLEAHIRSLYLEFEREENQSEEEDWRAKEEREAFINFMFFDMNDNYN